MPLLNRASLIDMTHERVVHIHWCYTWVDACHAADMVPPGLSRVNQTNATQSHRTDCYGATDGASIVRCVGH
jgi:hypothetical protein